MKFAVWIMGLGLALAANAEVLTIQNGHFTDAQGGTVLLRGVNLSGGFKTPPFTGKIKASDLDNLQNWGINTVRLVFIWEAFEPEMGKYDEKYLEWFKGLIAALNKRNIRVVIDNHQDIFSRWAHDGCGSGFPKWAVVGPTFEPKNGVSCEGWAAAQTTIFGSNQQTKSFDNLYRKDSDVHKRFLELFKRLATEFKGNAGVIGYDIINEPTGSWASQLLPLYEEVALIVNTIDPTKILFLEPTLGRLSTPFAVLNPGIEKHKPSFSNFAFATHYYDLKVILMKKLAADGGDTAKSMKEIADVATAWGVPVYIGEYSAINKVSKTSPEANTHFLNTVHQHFDKHFFSYARWHYTPSWTPADLDGWNDEDVSIVDDKGNLRHFQPRVEAERFAGVPTRIDSAGDRTIIAWNHEPRAGETVIFVPQGVIKKKSPETMECSEPVGLRIHCRSDQAGPAFVSIE